MFAFQYFRRFGPMTSDGGPAHQHAYSHISFAVTTYVHLDTSSIGESLSYFSGKVDEGSETEAISNDSFFKYVVQFGLIRHGSGDKFRPHTLRFVPDKHQLTEAPGQNLLTDRHLHGVP